MNFNGRNIVNAFPILACHINIDIITAVNHNNCNTNFSISHIDNGYGLSILENLMPKNFYFISVSNFYNLKKLYIPFSFPNV
jgi:hypothetical protein